jgi:hypothetical protein
MLSSQVRQVNLMDAHLTSQLAEASLYALETARRHPGGTPPRMLLTYGNTSMDDHANAGF